MLQKINTCSQNTVAPWNYMKYVNHEDYKARRIKGKLGTLWTLTYSIRQSIEWTPGYNS